MTQGQGAVEDAQLAMEVPRIEGAATTGALDRGPQGKGDPASHSHHINFPHLSGWPREEPDPNRL